MRIGHSHGIYEFRTPPSDFPMDLRSMIEKGETARAGMKFHPGDRKRKRRLFYYEHAGGNYLGMTEKEYLEMWMRIDEQHTDKYSMFRAPFHPRDYLSVSADNFAQWLPWLTNSNRGEGCGLRYVVVSEVRCENLFDRFTEILDYFSENSIPASEIYYKNGRIYLTERWLEFLDRKYIHYNK